MLATAIAAGTQVVVTSNVDDFITSGHVEAGRVSLERPGTFLRTVLDEHPEILDDALPHLAPNRRGVAIMADVLDVLGRNETLTTFVNDARAKLL